MTKIATEGASGASVKINAVSHAYNLEGGTLPVLDNVSLQAKPGEAIACLGPSGCGKSTLLRLVAGLEFPTRGSVFAAGQPVTGPGPQRILAFQDATLFPWATVWDNVATGLVARGELRGRENKVDELLNLVQLKTFAHAFPHQLSGGMAQRVSLARALINDPQVLLLDEPFGKLDSLTRMVLQDEYRTLWQQSRFTSLLVTHDVEEAILLSQRIIVFSQRPARVIGEFDVDLDFPRRREDRRVVKLRKEILAALGLGATSRSEAA